ncbi:MAG: bifunctional acetate--CoA ligase family protein/GNAT family N-acetyltransferase [Planctomycetia bacterium]|nr:bifunctional acetate--CoA ligase family protein/GNAT family N-acetyltransferase [Planctomycetia bacterium]
MGIRNLDRIFKPASVAVIGASNDSSKVGAIVLKNLLQGGFAGPVFPINARAPVVQGLPAFRSIREAPSAPDLAVICTPAAGVSTILDECGTAGVRGIVILSAGFRETGTAGAALERDLRDVWRRHDGMRIIGPNCLGIIVPGSRLNVSFAADLPQPGDLALVSQSGALCTSLLDWAVQQRIGFSHFVSVGNMLDAGFGDLIDYFGTDPATRAMMLYVESISDARGFISAARAFSRTKPIVAYKAGRFGESARAAASHTGAMAGEDAVCDAAFQRAGIERVFSIDDMFDCAQLLARRKIPRGPRLAIVTNAGGPGVMATDALIAGRGHLAPLSDATREALNGVLPDSWSHGNPIDVLGDAAPERFANAVRLVHNDPQVDAVLVILTPQAMTDPTATAERLCELLHESHKPVLAVWMGGLRVLEGRQRLATAGIPAYDTPEHAVSAFLHLVSYASNQTMLYETPRDVPLTFAPDREKLRLRFDELQRNDVEILSEADSKSLLELYGIPTTRTYMATTADEAVQIAQKVGYPVVLKILSPQITHKTEVGGVAVGLLADDGVRAAFERIVSGAKSKRPDAQIAGVTVQKMVPTFDGVELIVGAKKDATFGAVQLVGAGGITAELYRDRALGLPPLNERLARRMLESLGTWPLLNGYRGRPRIDVQSLIEVLMRVSYLIAEHPEIKELDINPLLATHTGAVALDARVVFERPHERRAVRPFSHLAIRPYPEEYVQRVTLSDGIEITLRPIRPEDEPLWLRLIASCSQESLHARFQYLFREATHEMAARYCFTDYDRELALVAQVEPGEEFAGVGRLVADVDHETAEFAILIADAWQGRGIGARLTERCLEIAGQWGIRTVEAITALDNQRMIAIFEECGFAIEYDAPEGMIRARKRLID